MSGGVSLSNSAEIKWELPEATVRSHYIKSGKNVQAKFEDNGISVSGVGLYDSIRGFKIIEGVNLNATWTELGCGWVDRALIKYYPDCKIYPQFSLFGRFDRELVSFERFLEDYYVGIAS